jgi:hypothetical protein
LQKKLQEFPQETKFYCNVAARDKKATHALVEKYVTLLPIVSPYLLSLPTKARCIPELSLQGVSLRMTAHSLFQGSGL